MSHKAFKQSFHHVNIASGEADDLAELGVYKSMNDVKT